MIREFFNTISQRRKKHIRAAVLSNSKFCKGYYKKNRRLYSKANKAKTIN